MAYRDDPEARADLSAALQGLGFALVFLLIVGGISFFWALNATPHAAGGDHAPAAATQH